MSDYAFTARASRRRFLKSLAGAAVAGPTAASSWQLARGQDRTPRPKVAAVVTEFTYRSHAHCILENFLKPYVFNGKLTDPGCPVVSMYVDQFPGDRDMARAVSKDYDIPIYPTIAEALCLGGDTLAVDGVLSIGEHGDYPYNEKGQHMYPRKRFFDEIVAVFKHSGRVAPVFNDKHLSYRWDWAKEMYDTARSLDIPFMAGSSVPLAQRRPKLEIEPGTKLLSAVSIHGGGVESYDFHGLEVLQSIVEFRAGGETGVSELQFLEGAKLWQAADAGRWPVDLAEAAMAAELGPNQPPLRELVARLVGNPNQIHGILLQYRDGFRGTVLAIGGRNRWNFACRVADQARPVATEFYVGPWQNRNLFKALSHAIQTHFRQRRAPYPVERTLLASGILDAAMQSRYEKGMPQQTPQLAIVYPPRDFRSFREMGASWEIITEDTPEPSGIDPNAGKT
jgi:hypothetical protein